MIQLWWLGAELLLHKKCHSAPVDQIPLGETIPAMSMFYVYNYISRAESSVGVMYRSSGPNTGSNPGGRRILKKMLCKYGNFSSFLDPLAVFHLDNRPYI